jgi:hypothetical protein
MNKTDDILEKLKNVQQPEMDLTEEILSLLPTSPQGESLTPVPSPVREGRSINFMPVIRTVLSLAAMWIVGFFIYLQYDVANPLEANNLLPSGGGREGGSTLREVYKYRLCQECKKTISYTQIRSMLYENK